MTIGRKIWLCMIWLLAAMVVSTSAGAQPAAGQVTVMTKYECGELWDFKGGDVHPGGGCRVFHRRP